MESIIELENLDAAQKFFKDQSIEHFKGLTKILALDIESLSSIDITLLKVRLKEAENLIYDINFIQKHTLIVRKDETFRVNSTNTYFNGIELNIKYQLRESIEFIKNRIIQIEAQTMTLRDESENVYTQEANWEMELRVKMQEHIIKTQNFNNKYEVILKFLSRETTASIVGLFLLLTLGICLSVTMFLNKEPLKIIESAFLLILGYFFGHSKESK
ncbi:hypothetical protein [Chryseobacterium contaminans]|uniref:hypothetical protein n=1 Tax=Chryseobacterium contaminans TaxID=1423959 RepID=UPI00301AD76B